MGTQLPSPKKGAEPPIFGPCLLWLNGCMHQDTTWYGGSRQPRRHCVRWCSPSPKGAQPPNCRQMSVVAKRLDGLKCRLVWIGPSLGPSDFVFDGDTPPPEKRHSPPPNFWPTSCGQTAGWIKMPLGTEVNLGPGDVVLDGVAASPLKRAQFSVHVCCGQTAG